MGALGRGLRMSVTRLGLLLVAVMLIKGYAVPILCGVFVLGPPLRFAVGWQRRRRSAKESVF